MRPERGWRLRLQDILEAIDRIEAYGAGLTQDQFNQDARTIDAVMYRVGVIGEAIANLPDALKARHPQIPWRDIRNMRNVLSHVYFGVDVDRVWSVIQDDIGELKTQIAAVLAAESATPD